METTPMLSPLLLGSVPHNDLLRRFPYPQEPVDNFRIDDLLDFSNDDDLCEESPAASGSMETEAQAPSLNGGKDLKSPRSSSALQEACQQASGGLCVPSDELADQLEWLSAFNEDSSYSGDRKLASLVSSGSLSGSKEGENSRTQDKFQSSSPVSVLEPSGGFYANSYPASSSHVPSRARSKRSRSGGRVWSLDTLIPTLVDNRLGGAQESPVFFGCPPESEPFVLAKKAKKATPVLRPLVEAPPRRCSHCLVQKTPQWRAGPMGPKTLCNACGVRYKSGRLVPEYRPAGSPSFVSEVHSNSHKRILEMRRMKEVEEQVVVGEEEDEDDVEEDCNSQTESCEEDPIGSREDPICTEEIQEDPTGLICSEEGPHGMREEEPTDPACIE